MQADQSRSAGQQKRRTYWVEEQGNWGFFTMNSEGMVDEISEIHWVGHKLPEEVVYDPGNNFEDFYEEDEVCCGRWRMMAGMAISRTILETDGQGTYWALDEVQNGLHPGGAEET